MGKNGIGRRSFLKGAGLAALGAAGVVHSEEGRAQSVVPNSAGTESPKTKAPANACDCHHHIYDARFPFAQPGARMVPNSRVADYRLLQRRIGTNRSVVVTPAPYPASVADNRRTRTG
jgi:D-galactarolactone isomerase